VTGIAPGAQGDVAAQFLADFKEKEGAMFIGKAQEKCKVYWTEKRRNP